MGSWAQMDAYQHASRASELLAGARSLSEDLHSMTPEDRLAASVTGGIARANEDLRWTVALAQAHALTAIALGLTTPGGG